MKLEQYSTEKGARTGDTKD